MNIATTSKKDFVDSLKSIISELADESFLELDAIYGGECSLSVEHIKGRFDGKFNRVHSTKALLVFLANPTTAFRPRDCVLPYGENNFRSIFVSKLLTELLDRIAAEDTLSKTDNQELIRFLAELEKVFVAICNEADIESFNSHLEDFVDELKSFEQRIDEDALIQNTSGNDLIELLSDYFKQDPSKRKRYIGKWASQESFVCGSIEVPYSSMKGYLNTIASEKKNFAVSKFQSKAIASAIKILSPNLSNKEIASGLNQTENYVKNLSFKVHLFPILADLIIKDRA